MTNKTVDMNNRIALELRNDDVWRQVFCAAVTGVLANPSHDTEPVDRNTDDAFDVVQFAAQVADEALGVTRGK